MEAKDTVIKYQKKHPVVAGSNEWHMIDGYNLGAEAQAEISFKAGIKEVVEWLSTCMLIEHRDTKNKDTFCRDYRVYDGEWEAKKQEWGIK